MVVESIIEAVLMIPWIDSWSEWLIEVAAVSRVMALMRMMYAECQGITLV